MNHLITIGDGTTYFARSVSDELSELEEIQPVSCHDAVEVLDKNSN